MDIPVEWIFTPLTAAIAYLRQAGATSCWLLGSPDAAKELTNAGINPADPNASHVLIGDLSDVLGYEMFVAGFRVLMRNHAELLALEHDRYFKGSDGLLLSAGAFVAALEFAADTSMIRVRTSAVQPLYPCGVFSFSPASLTECFPTVE